MGDTANVRAWGDGEVYVAALNTTAPSDPTTSPSGSWSDLGLLEQDAGAETSYEQDRTEVYSWGKGLARVLTSKHKREIKVVALETNAVVMDLINPGSSATTNGGVTTYVVKNPRSIRRSFLIKETDGDITRLRWIKTGEVTVSSAVTDGETQVSQYELTISIYPDASTSEIWTEISNDPAMASLSA